MRLNLILILFVYLTYIQSTLATPVNDKFTLEEATIQSIHDALNAKQISCEQLTLAYLNHIKKYNLSSQKETPLNAFTEINSNCLEDARNLDEYYQKNNTFKGALHCIPTVIKDNIDVKGMQTTSGSLALLGKIPRQDAFLTAKLRQAGAIIIGKTTMDEFAWGMIGISSRSGRTGNAYQAEKNPGGSSGGTAVAISANFAVIGIGTDNSGSIRIPAAFNGVVGLRPSTGIISQNGIFPMGNLDGTAGPITRTVTDLAKVMDVIAQNDSKDIKTQDIRRPLNYTADLTSNELKGKRIGIVHHVGNYDVFKGMSKENKAVFNEAYNRLKKQGAILVPDIRLSKFINDRKNNQAGEIEDVDTYLKNTTGQIKSFNDICHSDRSKNFGNKQSCLQFMRSIPTKKSAAYQKVLSIFDKNKIYVENIMNEQKLDALLMPIAKSGIATYDERQVNTWQAPVASNAGLPAIALIAGIHPTQSLPVGFELIGKQYSEPLLIQMAFAYESSTPLRDSPKMPEENENLLPLKIEEINTICTEFGKQAYFSILKKGKPKDLTPRKFQPVVERVLGSTEHHP
jgi:amidase